MTLTVTTLGDHLGSTSPAVVGHEYRVDAAVAITVYNTNVASAGTIQITDTDACQNAIITITTTDGTVITATETTTTTTTDTDTATWEASTGSSGSKRTGAAANIATCLNANSRLVVTSSSDTVTITQATLGAAGDTTITNTEGGIVLVQFTGGVTGDVISASDFGLNAISAAMVTGNSQAVLYSADIMCDSAGSYQFDNVQAQNTFRIMLRDNTTQADAELANAANITDTTIKVRVWGSK